MSDSFRPNSASEDAAPQESAGLPKWLILAGGGALVCVVGLVVAIVSLRTSDDPALTASADSAVVTQNGQSTDSRQTGGAQADDAIHDSSPNQSVADSAGGTPEGAEPEVDNAAAAATTEIGLASGQGAVEAPHAKDPAEESAVPPIGVAKVNDPASPQAVERQQPQTTPPDQIARAEPAVAPAAKAPLPDAAAQQEARKLVTEVFQEELDAATTREEKDALADTLLKHAAETNNNPAARYFLYDLARELAVETGNASLVVKAIDGIALYHDVDALRLKGSGLYAASGVAMPADDHRALIDVALGVMDEAASRDRFDIAVPMEQVLLRSASRVRDGELLEAIRARVAHVKDQAGLYEAIAAAREKLAEDPNDPDANTALGKYLVFVKGRWKEGLEHLSRSGDPALQAAAKAELSDPADARDQLELANRWYDLAEAYDGAAAKELLSRSLHWYQKTAPQQSGLHKVRTEKRIEDLNARLAEVSTATPLAADDAPSSPKESDATADWKPPGKNSTAWFRSFLGVYRHGMKKDHYYPFVNLTVPNGNLWTQEIQDKVRGHIPFEEIAYRGTAKILVPEDGVYILDAHRCSVNINGKDTGGSGEIRIIRGIHTVTLSVGTHGQPHLFYARISLRHKETGEEVPFVNSWQDILRFGQTVVAGRPVKEVTDWKPTPEGEVKIDRAGQRR